VGRGETKRFHFCQLLQKKKERGRKRRQLASALWVGASKHVNLVPWELTQFSLNTEGPIWRSRSLQMLYRGVFFLHSRRQGLAPAMVPGEHWCSCHFGAQMKQSQQWDPWKKSHTVFKSPGLEPGRTGITSQLCYLLDVWPSVSDLNFLGLSFHFCKVKMVVNRLYLLLGEENKMKNMHLRH